jgi:hypothetical protein
MTTATSEWLPCPIDTSDLDLAGDKLRGQWDRLHSGNLEPFPADETVQDAWRQYHLGNFARASEIGLAAGGAAVVPAAFATTIYAQYIEQDDKRKIELFKQAMAICKDAEAAGLSTPNLHYMYAVSMGRYSQFISMIEALAQGFGGRIKGQVEKCLELAPNHAEAHATFAGWHAGISDQAGALMARMLYGATQDGAHEHYDEAVKLAPEHVVPWIEYARGLEVMYGDSERAAMIEKLEHAMQLTAGDAMQRMDQEAARKQLAALKG